MVSLFEHLEMVDQQASRQGGKCDFTILVGVLNPNFHEVKIVLLYKTRQEGIG